MGSAVRSFLQGKNLGHKLAAVGRVIERDAGDLYHLGNLPEQVFYRPINTAISSVTSKPEGALWAMTEASFSDRRMMNFASGRSNLPLHRIDSSGLRTLNISSQEDFEGLVKKYGSTPGDWGPEVANWSNPDLVRDWDAIHFSGDATGYLETHGYRTAALRNIDAESVAILDPTRLKSSPIQVPTRPKAALSKPRRARPIRVAPRMTSSPSSGRMGGVPSQKGRGGVLPDGRY